MRAMTWAYYHVFTMGMIQIALYLLVTRLHKTAVWDKGLKTTFTCQDHPIPTAATWGQKMGELPYLTCLSTVMEKNVSNISYGGLLNTVPRTFSEHHTNVSETNLAIYHLRWTLIDSAPGYISSTRLERPVAWSSVLLSVNKLCVSYEVPSSFKLCNQWTTHFFTLNQMGWEQSKQRVYLLPASPSLPSACFHLLYTTGYAASISILPCIFTHTREGGGQKR